MSSKYDTAKDDGRILAGQLFNFSHTVQVTIYSDEHMNSYDIEQALRQLSKGYSEVNIRQDDMDYERQLISRHHASMWECTRAFYGKYPQFDILWWWTNHQGDPVHSHPIVCPENFPNGWDHDGDRPW